MFHFKEGVPIGENVSNSGVTEEEVPGVTEEEVPGVTEEEDPGVTEEEVPGVTEEEVPGVTEEDPGVTEEVPETKYPDITTPYSPKPQFYLYEKVAALMKAVETNEIKIPDSPQIQEVSISQEIAYPTSLLPEELDTFYLLSEFKTGNLLRELTKLREKYPIFPHYINSKQRPKYIRGLKLYLDAATLRSIGELTEEEVYYIAVVAYHYKDIYPLQNMYNHVNKLNDIYYWIFLAQTEELFFPVMEIEMYRRRTTKNVKMYTLNRHCFQFRTLPIKNVFSDSSIESNTEQRLFTPLIRHLPHFFHDEVDLLAVNKTSIDFSTVLNNYGIEVPALCNIILQNGGIIAGGFPNSLINPIYFVVPIEHEEIRYDRYEEVSVEFRDIDGRKLAIGNRINSQNGYHIVIPGFHDFIRAWYARYPPDTTNLSSYHQEMLKYDRIAFRDYDLDLEIEKLKQHIFIHDNIPHQLFYNYAPDMDVFIVGDDYLEKTNAIINAIYDKVTSLSDNSRIELKVHYSEFATTITLGKSYPKIQIIKRAYPSVKEVLAGFDLDSSRVAICLDSSCSSSFSSPCASSPSLGSSSVRNWNIIAPLAYMKAVEYGINLIVPCRQSQTFNLRLQKYFNKGFIPYLPDLLLHRFDFNSWKRSREVLRGTLAEFYLYYKDEKYIWHPKTLSDYDSKCIKRIRKISQYEEPLKKMYSENNVIFPDKRLKAINDGVVLPTQEDIFYNATKLTEYLNHRLSLYKRMSKDYEIVLDLLKELTFLITSLFWRVLEPSSQYTGSFNPTTSNYLAATLQEEEKLTIETETIDNLLIEVFPIVIVEIIALYVGLKPEHIFQQMGYFMDRIIKLSLPVKNERYKRTFPEIRKVEEVEY